MFGPIKIKSFIARKSEVGWGEKMEEGKGPQASDGDWFVVKSIHYLRHRFNQNIRPRKLRTYIQEIISPHSE